MRSLTVSLIVLFIFSHSTFGARQKADRTIYITSIERLKGNGVNFAEGYRVQAKTLERTPVVYYGLECGTNASRLEVDHSYRAYPATSGGEKILVILGVQQPGRELPCDILFERADTQK